MIRGSVGIAVSLLLLGGVMPSGAQPQLVKDVDPGVLDPQRIGSGIAGLTSLGARGVPLRSRRRR